ncbi:hypothetical protein ACQ4LE_007900 [Meloidogyne hapla]|uniref:Phospholysine phosphohistidine inorganic pyrophosphate phosphatase n=1 Tax=Meloidogyne hapla TaxID=6305 RepID=A0A1I8BCU5_MELHA
MIEENWYESVQGFLVDITGVLYDSGGCAIDGSVEAVNRLYNESNVRFVSNESTSTREGICMMLRTLGFLSVQPEHIFTPAPVAAQYIIKHGLSPHLLVHKNVLPEFSNCINFSNGRPCVVLADAESDLDFMNMNKAFRVLHASSNPLLISLGNGKFYHRADQGPCLDTGAYASALKFAVEDAGRRCEHLVIGKPEETYFMTAVGDLGLTKGQVVMIGDDISGDIDGAQKLGIKGIQVRTGKWRAEWEKHPTITPELIADNLLEAVTLILDNQQRIKN